MTSLEPVFTAAEVAGMEKITPQTVAVGCARGLFPGAYQTGDTGGQWRIPESAILAWRDRNKAPVVDDPTRLEPRNPRAAAMRRRTA